MGKFNEYTQKATPADNDTLMIYDATSKANKLSPFSGIWNWIVGKLTNAVISNLQTSNQTVLGAINELNSNRISSYASAASDKIPDGNEIAFFRAGENAIVVNENLTIPPWAFCIYIPFGRDAGLIVVGIGKVIAAYRMNSTWTYRYDIK